LPSLLLDETLTLLLALGIDKTQEKCHFRLLLICRHRISRQNQIGRHFMHPKSRYRPFCQRLNGKRKEADAQAKAGVECVVSSNLGSTHYKRIGWGDSRKGLSLELLAEIPAEQC
jgi:hypothetical protein